MIRKFIAAFALIFFMAASTTAFAAERKIVSYDGVTVEFPEMELTTEKDGVIFAKGLAVGPLNWDKQDSFYKTFARQAARITALRELAEYIGGIFIETKTVGGIEIITTQIPQNSKAFKLLKKNAQQIGVAEFYNDGGCELFMAIRVKPRK